MGGDVTKKEEKQSGSCFKTAKKSICWDNHPDVIIDGSRKHSVMYKEDSENQDMANKLPV
jgi:hypothetical protein